MSAYQPPVDQFLTLGDCNKVKDWPDYPTTLGITDEHIPELIRMATDDQLHTAPSDSDEVWAPVYAWVVLGQLQAVEAVEALVGQLKRREDDDWVRIVLPATFANIGAAAIPALQDYIFDIENDRFARDAAVISLQKMAEQDKKLRGKIINILNKKLGDYKNDHPSFNAFVINTLADLQAEETHTLIEHAYKDECVDSMVLTLEDVEVAFGLRPQPPISDGVSRPMGDPMARWQAFQKQMQAWDKEHKKRQQRKRQERNE